MNSVKRLLGLACLLCVIVSPLGVHADDDDDDGDSGGGGSPIAEVLVRCDRGDSINDALALAPGFARFTVIVQGTCTEFVFIAADNVTVKGDPIVGGRVEGRFTVDGASRVRIEDLTISGGDRGIRVNFGAYVRIADVTIENMSRTGIAVFNGGVAFVQDSTILGPAEDGMLVSEGGVLDVRNATVEGTDFGITASNGGVLNLEDSRISAMRLDGLQISGGASARLVSNDIRDVARNAIQVVQNAFVRIRNSTLIAPTSTEEVILVDGGSLRLEGGNTLTGLNGALSIRARNNATIRQFIGLGSGRDVLNGQIRVRQMAMAGFAEAEITGGIKIEWKSFVDLAGEALGDLVVTGDVVVSHDSQILLSSFGPQIFGEIFCSDDESSLSNISDMATISGGTNCTGFD